MATSAGSSTPAASTPYILGLDLGVASIGWARIACDPDDGFKPLSLLQAGAHLFEAGTEGSMNDIASGRDEPRNVQRRMARQMRKQIWRRARRKRKLLLILIRHGLLPSVPDLAERLGLSEGDVGGNLKRPLDIDAYLKVLDYGVSDKRARSDSDEATVAPSPWAGFAAQWTRTGTKDAHPDRQNWPYRIRAAAAVSPIDRHDLGRALYHLAQRRGFLSNRRADAKKAKETDKEKSEMKLQIGRLQAAIDAHNPPTLGAYLASVDPFAQHDPKDADNPAARRLRGRWTSRKMYLDEFQRMWTTQTAAEGGSPLADPARKDIWEAIFYQRPLKAPARSMGKCFLEAGERRLRLAHPLYQEFRILQVVNDLRVLGLGTAPQPLTQEHRERLTKRLMNQKELSFDTARTLLKLPADVRFSHERITPSTRVAHIGTQTLSEALGMKKGQAADAAAKAIDKRCGALTIETDQDDPRPLTPAERTTLATAWKASSDFSVDDARHALMLGADARFLLVSESTTNLVGNKTAAALRGALDEAFELLSRKEQACLVSDLCGPLDDEALLALLTRSRPTPPDGAWLRLPVAERGWGFTTEQAAALTKTKLEEQRGALSLKAIRSLLPELRKGVPYATAVKAVIGTVTGTGAPWPQLPPIVCFDGHENEKECHQQRCGSTSHVAPVLRGIRNPSVQRALTELRKLVNEMVRRHGVPALIRVELARDLKNPRHRRKEMTAANDRRRDERESVRGRIADHIAEHGIAHPTEEDVDKVLLANECRWLCPYTGRTICWGNLFTEFDVEHIWPRSRSLDDSLLNKTLCFNEENCSRKRGHTPREAYGGNEDRFEEIMQRLRAFKCDPFVKAAKLARFEAESIPDGFSNRHLADTRYIAAAAADYIGLLYGGRVQGSAEGTPGTRRVDITTGGLTAWLRTGWGIDGLLGETGEKNREDHRHHAVDAIVAALSDTRAVQTLARAAEAADKLGKRRAFEHIDEPWPGFRHEADGIVKKIIVSHRQSRKVSGPLHDQSIYSKPIAGPGGRTGHRIRKELHKLSVSEIRDGKIIDKRALEAIRAMVKEQLGTDDPNPRDLTKLLTEPTNAPFVKGHDGRMVRLRKVRIEADAGRKIGRGASERWVQPANNHHTVVVEVRDAKGRVRWEDRPLQLIDAYARQAAKQPIVGRTVAPGERFVFSLSPGEFVEMGTPDNATQRAVYRVASISEGDCELKLHTDARTADALKKAKARVRVSGEKLRKAAARKVRISYLGEVLNAGG